MRALLIVVVGSTLGLIGGPIQADVRTRTDSTSPTSVLSKGAAFSLMGLAHPLSTQQRRGPRIAFISDLFGDRDRPVGSPVVHVYTANDDGTQLRAVTRSPGLYS